MSEWQMILYRNELKAIQGNTDIPGRKRCRRKEESMALASANEIPSSIAIGDIGNEPGHESPSLVSRTK